MDNKRGRIFLYIGKVYWMKIFISTLGDSLSKEKSEKKITLR